MTIHTRPSPEEALPHSIDYTSMEKALEALATLKARGIDNDEEPSSLRADQIDTLENVFQARGGKLNERHLGELETGLRDGHDLEPLTLWRCGAYAFLLDGHHRLEAYRRAQRAQHKLLLIPVTWFRGSAEEAAVRAAAANTRAKLPMSSAEKLDHAWRMVLTERFTVKQTEEAASVSPRTVKNMRKALRTLGNTAGEYRSWRGALAATQGREGWSAEDAEAMAEALAKNYADRLAKEFSTKLARNPEVTAKAFLIHFNRASRQVLKAWLEEVGEDWEAWDEEERGEPEEGADY